MIQNLQRDTLSVVIPALNEEEAIGGTIARCLESVAQIRETAGLEGVEIIVVSDGSTDRTAEIAGSFPGVKLIVFEQNRGYGAAIKEGFRQAGGSLLGFLDADGTCDPRYFGEMCRRLIAEDADVVLGSRLGPETRMPKIRRLGNRFFACLMTLLTGRRTTDTASGMRVLRRGALDDLYPLPDGLHFTPSMSARALLNGLRLLEVPMDYHERTGESKLRIFSDGWRFLRVILADVLCYRPERLFMMGFLFCLVVGMFFAAYPIWFYARHREVEDWMFYRFPVCGLLGAVGYQLLAGAALTYRMATFGPRRCVEHSFWFSAAVRLFEGWIVVAVTAILAAVSLVLLWPGVWEYATTLTVSMHWSRFVTAVFLLLLAGQSAIGGILMRVLSLWKAQLPFRNAASR